MLTGNDMPNLGGHAASVVLGVHPIFPWACAFKQGISICFSPQMVLDTLPEPNIIRSFVFYINLITFLSGI